MPSGRRPRTRCERSRARGSLSLAEGPRRAILIEIAMNDARSADDLTIDVLFEEQESTGTPAEPSVVLHESLRPPVARFEGPTRHFGPRGTVRMVARRDLGPSGTVLIRRRQRPWRERLRLSSGTRAMILMGVVICALVTLFAALTALRRTGSSKAPTLESTGL